MTITRTNILRLIAIACIIVALIAVTIPTRILDANWVPWFLGGALAFLLEPFV